MAAISPNQVAKWLSDTTSSDESVLRSATFSLESASHIPGFVACLLSLSAETEEQEHGWRIAAATYLKNFIREHWYDHKVISENEHLEFRNQLVEVLLRVDYTVLKLLIEAFRLVANHDFAEKNTWPDLIPALQTAIQNSDLVNYSSGSKIKTLNALMAVQAITKPFQYFLNPTVAKEPVPTQLESIAKEILLPLHGLFHHLVEQVRATRNIGAVSTDNALLVLCKTVHLAVKSHMPISLLPSLGNWFQDCLAILDNVILDYPMSDIVQLPRMKAWKRTLQLFCTLVTRHRKHIDKLLPAMANAALKIVACSANAKELHVLQERVISQAFDVLSNILETGPGWRLLAPHFSLLLESAIFPALRMKDKDAVEWREDEEEYLQKNLPSDLDAPCGWREDLFTPRRSALNLLGLIATSKGPPTAGAAKKVAAVKRKKKDGKGKDGQGTAGELLVMPFLSQYPVPSDGTPATSEPAINYYGVLLAYGSLQEFLKLQSPEYVERLLQTRVLPLFSMSLPSPYVLANANWLLGELAACLPEALNGEIYESLLKALIAPDVENISWRPVRASAAGALSVLIQEDYKPAHWLPLLQAAVAGARVEKEEDITLSLQLLSTAAEAGEEDIAPHVPAIAAAVKVEILKHIPPLPEPLPQVVELGFSAMAALIQNWDSTEPEENDEANSLGAWKSGCETIADIVAELLQQAWLAPPQDFKGAERLPPPSCLNDASLLLGALVKYTSEPSQVRQRKIDRILQIWADLVADWKAWDEEEDLNVFEAIREVLALHGRCPLEHFAVAELPPPPALPVPSRSILEGMAAFVSSAIETAYAAATWRACRIAHSLLHSTAVSFEGHQMTEALVCRFTEVSFGRLHQLSSQTVPLAKPLILVIATCYVGLPGTVENVLTRSHSTIEDLAVPAFVEWAESLASIVEDGADTQLSLESELKLAVMALVKLVDRFSYGQASDLKVARHCCQSLLNALVQLKEVQEEQVDDEDEDEEEQEENDSESEDDSEDDSEESEREETEEEFLERYAETARELEEEAIEEVEGGQEEDGHELDLGVLGLATHETAAFSCIQRLLATTQPFPSDLMSKFVDKFPHFKASFS